MEYISAEEFLGQPVEVQKVFLDWWKPSLGDLVCVDTGKFADVDIYNGLPYRKNLILKCLENERDIELLEYDCPLLVEGQLRQFIEDKTDCKLEVMYIKGYSIRLSRNNPEGKNVIFSKRFLEKDLLKSYWKVALEIAKEKVKA